MNKHSTETQRVLDRWMSEQGKINACARCYHGSASEGRICTFGVAVKAEVARSKDGRCGPDAALLYIPRVIEPSASDMCNRCKRPKWGTGCCHCPSPL